MTPAKASKRIQRSEETLERYLAMMDGGVAPIADLPMIEAELQILSDIAGEHPDDAMRLYALVDGWVKFRERLRSKMH